MNIGKLGKAFGKRDREEGQRDFFFLFNWEKGIINFSDTKFLSVND